jgi:hypothetical protein
MVFVACSRDVAPTELAAIFLRMLQRLSAYGADASFRCRRYGMHAEPRIR